MTLTRRRFLRMSAGAVALAASAPARAAPLSWRGRALGADVSLQVVGLERADGARLWRHVQHELGRVERCFSLYRATELTRLNDGGYLAHPSAALRSVCALSDAVHDATGGAFDPTVQALWQVLAEGRNPVEAQAHLGWRQVERGPGAIRLRPGMALTFNGIAQGYAADRIAALMRREGLENVLIDMGEIVALGERMPGRPWQVGIAGADGAVRATPGLCDRALATSSPSATRVGPSHMAHIMHPSGQPPLWRTVSVSAPEAALADALSTAFCLMDRTAIAVALARFPQARLEYLG